MPGLVVVTLFSRHFFSQQIRYTQLHKRCLTDVLFIIIIIIIMRTVLRACMCIHAHFSHAHNKTALWSTGRRGFLH